MVPDLLTRLATRGHNLCFGVVLGIATAAFSFDADAADPRTRGPDAGIPRLERTSAREAQAAWMAVKGISGAGPQVEAVAKKGLLRKACDDLVDLRELADSGVLKGFGFRDNVRGRSWARPTLALVLSEAMQRFQAEYPGRSVAIGDVSQPGCGQLAHGVLVQEVSGAAAEKLIAAARLELSERIVVEVKQAKDFPWEADRFGPPAEKVLVTTRLVAQKGTGDALEVRVARTRHRELPAPTSDETQAFEASLGAVIHGTRVAQRKVESEDAAGVKSSLWLTHFVLPDAKKQAVVITRKRPGKRLDWADVSEVRLSAWQDKKPGSFPDEVRWVVASVTPTPPVPGKQSKKKVAPVTLIAAVRFDRWALLYEAGHITHLSGIDADLSYVMVGDKGQFAVDLPGIDVPATLRWFEILEATGRNLSTPVDAILVDGTVKRHFEKTLPKTGPVSLAQQKKTKSWRLIALVGGHDGHHHLRIVEGSNAQEAAARKRLRR